jgi:hypothetical protein
MSWLLGTYCHHKCKWAQTKVYPSYGSYISVPSAFWISCFIATNSAPKTEDSMVGCCFDCQTIGAKLQKIKKSQYGSVKSFSLPHGHCLPSYGGQRLCQGGEACQEELLFPFCHKTPSNQKMERQSGQCQGNLGQR